MARQGEGEGLEPGSTGPMPYAVNKQESGETGGPGGYNFVERFINAPFTSLGSSQAQDPRGLPLLSQALPSATSQ